MLKSTSWAIGYAARKTTDYLVGKKGESKGLISEMRASYKAGTHGWKPPVKTKVDGMDPEVREWCIKHGWTLPK